MATTGPRCRWSRATAAAPRPWLSVSPGYWPDWLPFPSCWMKCRWRCSGPRRLKTARSWQPARTPALCGGAMRDLLVAERLLLNLVGHLSGIATLTRQYVQQTAGTSARIYDTRKTLPGYRRLEKYAVRCGGGHNHRTGLFDAILIKDNHLAFGRSAAQAGFTPAEAVAASRQFLQATLSPELAERMIVEVEVDSLQQLDEVLPACPDIVLLDNLPPEQLAEAVRRRDAAGSSAQLEASGGVRLESVGRIAQSGVDRISVGALTHSAPWLDVGLDWSDAPTGDA